MTFFKAKKGPVPAIAPSPEWSDTNKMERRRLIPPTNDKRVVIVGGPKTGKTTLANEIAGDGGTVFRTDDLIGTHSWEDVPDAIIEWMHRPGPWVIEGVQTARALRRWLKNDEGLPMQRRPFDQIIVKTHAFVELNNRQAGMAKGVMKVWKEVEPLLGSAVDVVYW